MNPNEKISPHFRFREMYKSHTADRLNINNRPYDPYIIQNLKRLAEKILEPIRVQFMIPFTPNSTYRCLELNTILKSDPRSKHVKGQATDVELSGVDNFSLYTWCQYNLDFDQLILEFYNRKDSRSGWIHISYLSPSKNRSRSFMLP